MPAPIVAQRKIGERVAWPVAAIAVVAALALAFLFFRRAGDEPRVLTMSPTTSRQEMFE